MTDILHAQDTTLGGSPQPVLEVRPLGVDDRRFAACSWRESYKDAPGMDRMPWPLYRQLAGKQIDALVNDGRTHLLGAFAGDGRIVGWLAYVPGRSISTVHWSYTRFKLDDEKCRRRGVMTLLLDAAELGRRFAYTFRGPRRHGGSKRTGRGESADVPIVEWLRTRGVTAVHVPIEEWLK